MCHPMPSIMRGITDCGRTTVSLKITVLERVGDRVFRNSFPRTGDEVRRIQHGYLCLGLFAFHSHEPTSNRKFLVTLLYIFDNSRIVFSEDSEMVMSQVILSFIASFVYSIFSIVPLFFSKRQRCPFPRRHSTLT